jgi:hypothetical protein
MDQAQPHLIAWYSLGNEHHPIINAAYPHALVGETGDGHNMLMLYIVLSFLLLP